MVKKIPAIEMRNILVRFEGKTILSGFNMTLPFGEKVVLTGDSGLGKSTLLRCTLGFVLPTEGEIFIHGQQLLPESVWNLRKQIAYVPQEPDLGKGTLEEWFKAPFAYRANAALKGNLRRLPTLMERLSLSKDLLRMDASALSGGEKQRAAIIAALLLERNIFLLDEPTSALDGKNTDTVIGLLSKASDASILAVSHDPRVLHMANQVITLSGKGGNHAR
ncbi:MAG: ABC transporter ATP-binding protein [Deltaproteobacteria bacterium]